jgi:uncharacterized protein
LDDRFMPFHTSEAVRPAFVSDPPLEIERERKPVIYRIFIEEITGKYEKNN